MRFPYEPVVGGYIYGGHPTSGALTGRYVNGHVHLFTTVPDENGGYHSDIAELADTESYDTNYLTAPRMIALHHYGNLDGPRNTTYVYNADGNSLTGQPNCAGETYNAFYTKSIFWSEQNQLLYLMSGDTYVNYNANWALWSATLHDDNTATTHGPWRLGVSGAPHVEQYYNNFYGLDPNGLPLVGGSIASGNSGSPWGPNLFSGDLPLANATVGCNAITMMPNEYVDYPAGNPSTVLNRDGSIIAGQILKSAKRIPANYNWPGTPGSSNNPWPFINPDLNAGNGSWTSSDRVYAGAWINLPDKVGMIFGGGRGEGKVWYGAYNDQTPNDNCGYGTQGEHSEIWASHFWIYDPTDLNKVKNGQVNPWDIQWKSDFGLSELSPLAVTTCGGGSNNSIRGMYFSPETRKLYVSVEGVDSSVNGLYQNEVYVFYIRDANNPYTPTPSPTSMPSPTSSLSVTPTPTPSPTTSPAPNPSANLVQSKANFAQYTYTVSIPFDSSITAGNTIIIALERANGLASGNVSVSDNRGNAYTEVAAVGNHAVWIASNVSGGQTTVTINSASGPLGAIIHEYSGIVTSNPIDKIHTATGNALIADSGATPTTTQASELVFGYIGHKFYQRGPSNGFGQIQLTAFPFEYGELTEDKIVSATGQYNATDTSNGVSNPFDAIVVTLKLASPTGLQGDLNHDGIVNSLDWSLMNSHWFTNDATADLNHDGLVNSLDFSLLNTNWLKTQ